MSFAWPIFLLALPLVVAVAAWALLRPARRIAVVGSLRLWRQALQNLPANARRRTRRVSLSWVLLLAGAIAAVLAASSPIIGTHKAVRRVAIAPIASAELASGKSLATLRQSAGALLDRLGADDQVQLLLPTAAGGNTQFMSVAEARKRVDSLVAIPAPAADLLPAPADASVQHTYYFVAAADVPGGPAVSVVRLPGGDAVDIDAIAAEPARDNRVQLFVAARCVPGTTVDVRAIDASGTAGDLVTGAPMQMSGSHGRLVKDLPAAPAYEVLVKGQGAESVAYLARQQADVRKVALVGAEQPLLRKYVQADKGLELVASAEGADIVIANGVNPPADKPALVIDPPADPRGYRRDKPAGPVSGHSISSDAGDPVMEHVSFGDVAFRRVAPWIASDEAPLKVLAALDGRPVILRDWPEKERLPSEQPRRIYVAMDVSPQNTDMSMSESMLIFLANATRWLSPARGGSQAYGFVTPLQAGPREDWQAVKSVAARAPGMQLPWPGLYRDDNGRLQAVSLPVVQAATSRAAPADPMAAVAALPLPAASPVGGRLALWPALAIAAGLLWIAGWTLRLR